VCHDLRGFLLQEGFPADRIGVVYNGIDPGDPPSPAERARARERLGAGPDDLVVGSVARLDPVKDLGSLIDATARAVHKAHTRGVDLRISVNLSARDLMDQDLAAKTMAVLQQHGTRPQSLCLEITESAIMDDAQRAMLTLEQLRKLGFRLSIDDFGTGYSSLAYLKRLAVDELKIDKSFVLAMERDHDDAKIVRSTIELAHNLGLTVVAEGIETVRTWKLLAALGCDEGQGYCIARPMPEPAPVTTTVLSEKSMTVPSEMASELALPWKESP